MKKAIITALLALALPLVSQAQKQTFNLPAFFATNVYLYDNTNLPLHLRISGSAVSNVQDWATLAAITNINVNQFDLDNVGGIDFDTTPTGTIAAARMQWNPDFETVRLGLDAAVSLDIGQQHVAFVRNAESVTISNGMVVYISGASGDKAEVKIASYSNDTLSARTIGIAAENITAGNTGFVVTRGPVYAQKTDTFTAGAMLYLGAYGNVTTNRPQAPLHGVFVGVVEKVNANAGVIYVAVQNGFEMDELHDVNVGSPATNDLLIYNGTVWTNYARTNLSGIYLPLTGGTMATDAVINMSEGALSNVLHIGWFGGGEGYIDFEEQSIFGSGWTFQQQPQNIPGYINTNNLSTIAGSGLGVTGNQLVVTNISQLTFTTNIDLSGNYSVTNALALYGLNTYGYINLPEDDYPELKGGWKIDPNLRSSLVWTSNIPQSYQKIEWIYTSGADTNKIYAEDIADLVIMHGNSGKVTIKDQATSGHGKLYANHYGNAANLTNFPSSLLTVSAGNANYWRITTAPTGATSSGSSGQLAVSGTNIYIYSPNALGVGTARWLRVTGDAAW